MTPSTTAAPAKGQWRRRSEAVSRSVVKALSYRIYSTSITMTIAFVVTGDRKLALSIGGFDVMVKIGTYFIHERIWIVLDRALGRRAAAKAQARAAANQGLSLVEGKSPQGAAPVEDASSGVHARQG